MTSFDAIAAQLILALKGQSAGSDSAKVTGDGAGEEFFTQFSTSEADSSRMTAQDGIRDTKYIKASLQDARISLNQAELARAGFSKVDRSDSRPAAGTSGAEVGAGSLRDHMTASLRFNMSAESVLNRTATPQEAKARSQEVDTSSPARTLPSLDVSNAGRDMFYGEAIYQPASPDKAADSSKVSPVAQDDEHEDEDSDTETTQQSVALLANLPSAAGEIPHTAKASDSALLGEIAGMSSVPAASTEGAIAEEVPPAGADLRATPAGSVNAPAASTSIADSAQKAIPAQSIGATAVASAEDGAEVLPQEGEPDATKVDVKGEEGGVTRSEAAADPKQPAAAPAQSAAQLKAGAAQVEGAEGKIVLPEGMEEIPEDADVPLHMQSASEDDAAPIRADTNVTVRTVPQAQGKPEGAIDTKALAGSSDPAAAIVDEDAPVAADDAQPVQTAAAGTTTATGGQTALAMQAAAQTQSGGEKYIAKRREASELFDEEVAISQSSKDKPSSTKVETPYAVTASTPTAGATLNGQAQIADPLVLSQETGEVSGDDRLRFGLTAATGHAGQTATAASASLPAAQQAMAQNVSQQITRAVSNTADGTVELTLAPEELGKVRMVMHHSDQGMSVLIYADRPETLDLMRRHAEMLSRDLRELGYTDVNLSFTDQGQNGQNAQELVEQVERVRAERGTQAAFNADSVSNTLNASRASGSVLGGLDLRM